MRKGLYLKLALVNIKNHRRLFVPFMLSCAGCVAMFDIMLTLMFNSFNILTRGGASTLGGVLVLGAVVVGFFSVFIAFYANSFIIKRRKKEFGLYNVLGMEKRHIAGVMGVEAIITGAASIVAGFAFAAIFSRLLVLILYKIIGTPALTNFELSGDAALWTLALFACVFAVMYIFNVSRMGLSSSIELLHGGEVGEREPKTKWLITAIGVLTLGCAYYLALTTKEPAMALALFFVAVMLVIIGTYCLFASGSIALLKALRKNKRYYYKPNHFTSVSGMIYRMKQMGVGLANICILSTMVLVMLSSTICLYNGMEDTLTIQFTRDITITGTRLSDAACRDFRETMDGVLSEHKGEYGDLALYRYAYCELASDGDNALRPISDAMDFVNYSQRVNVYMLPLADYMSLQGAGAVEFLENGTVMLYSPDAGFDAGEIAFGDAVYKAARLEDMNIDKFYSPAGGRVLYVVAPTADDIKDICAAVDAPFRGFSLRAAFNADASDEGQIALFNGIRRQINEHMSANGELYKDSYLSSSCEAEVREEYMGLYGGLLFLGIFLGLMFTTAAALIMYYRQISEGYDDSRRYEIMRNVGMSANEVAKSIKSQVLTVFFLPLGVAGVHIAFAFPMIVTLFKILRLTNVQLFAQSTIICFVTFALVYLAVYALTARTYYKIVSRPAV